jgi:RNA polymerase sigma factor (sigma-70 family)
MREKADLNKNLKRFRKFSDFDDGNRFCFSLQQEGLSQGDRWRGHPIMAKENPFKQVLDRALAGDRDAQAELYLTYGDHIRMVIRKKLRDLKIQGEVDPHDLFDSVFARMFIGDSFKGSGLNRIEDVEHFLHYIEKAVRNKCYQVLRKVMQRPTIRIDDCPGDLFEDDSAANELEELAWSEELEQAYSQLSSHERMICWLLGGGYAWEEIGNRLTISADSARMTYRRAEERTQCCVIDGKALSKQQSRVGGNKASRVASALG